MLLTVSIIALDTINYHDTYLPSSAQGYAARPATNHYGTPIVENTKGLPTVNRVRVLDVSPAQWITTTTGYDKKGRAVWVRSVNDYLQTSDLMEHELDFVGRVSRSRTTHNKTGQPTITTEDTFTYGHMPRAGQS